MNHLNGRFKSFCISTWHYLIQPIGDSQKPVNLNLWNFYKISRIRFLEGCWELDWKPDYTPKDNDVDPIISEVEED